MTHICVSKLTIIGSDNGLSPGRRQAIIWTNAGILLIQILGTNFSEILGKIHSFSFKKMHLKMSSAKGHLLSLSLNELKWSNTQWNLLIACSIVPWYGMWRDNDKCIDRLVQERHNSRVLASQRLSCTNPSVSYRVWTHKGYSIPLNHCITAACSVISCLSYVNYIRMILLSHVACYQALVMVTLIVSCPLHLAWPMNTS